MLASLCFALGARRDATARKIMGPEQKTPREATMRNVFKPDSRPIVAEQQLSQEQLAKTYYRKGETRRRVEAPVMPTQRRATTVGGGTMRKLTTQAHATATTQRKTGQKGRLPAVSSLALRPAGTLRRVQPVQVSREKVSKGYVAKNPTARHIAVPKKAPVVETRRRLVKPAQSVRTVARPAPALDRRAKRQPTAQAPPPTKPAVLQQVRKTERRPVKPGVSTRRVLSLAPAPKPAALRAETTRRAMSRGRGPMPVRIQASSNREELVPVRTMRRIDATARRVIPAKKPVYAGKVQPSRRAVLRSLTPESEDLVLDMSSSEPPVRTRRLAPAPPQKRKPVQTLRKVQQPKRKPARKVVVEQSDSESSTTTTSFERQFTRRKIVARPSKGKPAKRHVSSSTSEVIETEIFSSSTPEPSTSSSSLPPSPPARTKRKAKPVATQRKATKPAKKPVKGKKHISESTSSEAEPSEPPKKTKQTATRRAVKKPEPVKKPAKKPVKEETVESESEIESSLPKPPKKEATRSALKKPEATTRRAVRKESSELSAKAPSKKPKAEATRMKVIAKPEATARKAVSTKRKVTAAPKKEERKKKQKKRVVSSSTSTMQEDSTSSETEVDSSESVSEPSSSSSSSHRPAKTRRAVTAKPPKAKSPVIKYKTKGRR